MVNGLLSGSNFGSNGQQQTTQQGSQQQQSQVSQPQQQQQQQQVQPAATTAPTTSTPSSSSGLSAFAQQTLDRHNYYRARHTSTPALRWSSSLAADAQAWANRCVFEHANNAVTGQGENLAWGYPDTNSVIDAYYSESSGYAYGASQPSDWHSVGHFTQMVWVATTDVGCAVTSCSGGAQFHVCRYYPPGNVQGQYASNVLPPRS
ncbi:hypothetical protein PLESTB_000093500 [Pleodorina starrii]|uniref:SCP domain-containing protein n=1 Tax=Pleodorina starrii TaxID=330485 RepID=A0A9W6EXG2_9CHLO|nr:hypothetical protein PLESTM_000090100 [Pleodorina starrii]GLC48404.1 hypothetical protein PLESTB_000093500 [Pleodorina starrii]GLC71725.1 hypothetical protein PLESTF_001159200 [Pleodorina starrii]